MNASNHSAKLINLGDESSFSSVVEKSEQPVLVDFWAPWCGPCRMLTPILEEVAAQVGESAKIVKVNVDDHQSLASRFGVQAVPTMIVFRNGEPVKRLTGVHGADALLDALAV